MKYAVITYIFGKNQEILREPTVIDKDVEYICVTDLIDLKSNVWKMVYEPQNEIKSLRDKVALVKFNPFKYTTAEKILIHDSSLNNTTSLLPIFDDVEKYDICLKKHPLRDNLAEELPNWKARGLTNEQITAFYMMAQTDKKVLTDIQLYECCVMCIHNNELTRALFKSLLTLMRVLGVNGNMIVTQQCPFAYLLSTYYNTLRIGFIDQSKYFIRYFHNTNIVNHT